MEQPCKCRGVCLRKKGSINPGCPWKTNGKYCIASCKCLLTGKKCQNQVKAKAFSFLLFTNKSDLSFEYYFNLNRRVL